MGNQKPNFDEATLNHVSISQEHHEIHEGGHFNVRDVISLPSSGDTFEWCVQTPNTKKWAHWIFEIEGTTETQLHVYEDATLSGGTVMTPFNNNRNSSNTSDLIITQGCTISGTSPTSGTLLEFHSKGLAGATPAKATSVGESEREDEWIFKSGTQYLVVITNADDNNTNIVDYAFRWYEHTNKI